MGAPWVRIATGQNKSDLPERLIAARRFAFRRSKVKFIASGILAAGLLPPGCSVMHAMESVFKLFLEIGKWLPQRRSARNDDIVEARTRGSRRQLFECSLEPAPDAIAVDGRANLLGDRETEARSGAGM